MNPCRRRTGVLKALKVLKIWSDSEGRDYVNEFKNGTNWTKRMISTRSPCSCSCCGNPRRNKWESINGRMTMQERKSEISFKEQIQDVFKDNDNEISQQGD